MQETQINQLIAARHNDDRDKSSDSDSDNQFCPGKKVNLQTEKRKEKKKLTLTM